jgi:hypothetical protein
MSKLEVDAIEPQSGTTLTIGASGDSVNLGSGASLTSPGLTLSDNILFNTASKGIYLGVTSATASNLLDDYEEGTWTPVYSDGTNNSNAMSTQVGKYVKIGKYVSVTGICQQTSATSNGLTGAQSLRISGLPFTSSSDLNRCCGSVATEVGAYNAPSERPTRLRIGSSTNEMIPQYDSGGSGSNTTSFEKNMLCSMIQISGNNSRMYFQMSYETDA